MPSLERDHAFDPDDPSLGAALAAVPGPRGGPAEPTGGNFVALGTYCALLVLYGQGWIIASNLGPGLWGLPLWLTGVAGLLACAGYVGAWALERRLGVPHFLVRSAVRFLPALAVSLAVTILAVGLVATMLPFRAYLREPLTARYMANLYLRQQPFLPGAFTGQNWAGAAHGTLWTLLPGAVGLPVLAALARLGAPPLRAVLLAATALLCGGASLWLRYAYAGPPLSVWRADPGLVLGLLPFLLGGACVRTLEARWAGLCRADAAILCFVGNWIAASWLGEYVAPLLWATIPYMAACAGQLSAPLLGRLGQHVGNPVLGMVLYGFPLQQSLALRMPAAPVPILTGSVLAVAAGLLSWHLVERPALRAWEAARTRIGRIP